MKLVLIGHGTTRKTLKLLVADTVTLYGLCRWLNPKAPSAVHLRLIHKAEFLRGSPQDTLLSLGLKSGDHLFYFVDDPSPIALVQNGKSSERNLIPRKDPANDSLIRRKDPANGSLIRWKDLVAGSMRGMKGPKPMDVKVAAIGNKRLSELFFLKKMILEKSGDTSAITIFVLSVYAIMIESGFVLLDDCFDDKFRFSKEIHSVSLRYTLPDLIIRDRIEFVTVTVQRLAHMVVIYGKLGGSSVIHRVVHLDKSKFVRVVHLVLDTLKFEKQTKASCYSEVLKFWRMVKDGLVMPLLIDLCDKTGLESPPCFMSLPRDLKLKILELLPGVSIGNMACVCTELRHLASLPDNDFWKQKVSEEFKNVDKLTRRNWKNIYILLVVGKKRICKKSVILFPKTTIQKNSKKNFAAFG